MGAERILEKLLSRTSDANLRFDDLHVTAAKPNPIQVRQVRTVILKYGLTLRND